MTIRIAPSIMCADLCHLADEVGRLEAAGADLLHFDVMDARFTPNMPLGLEVIGRLRSITDLPFDIHLMVEDNVFFIDRLLPLGVQWISVHAESAVHLDRILSKIRDGGVKAGVALNPATPLTCLTYTLERIDFVMLMTVEPGFAGQKMVPSALRKIADCRRFLDERGMDIPIEVDGNVSFVNTPAMVGRGAEILVAGTSSLFDPSSSIEDNMRKLRAAAAGALAVERSD